MSRGQYQPVSLVWLVIAAVMVVFFVYQVANAQHKCQGGHNCNDAGLADINIGGDKSRVYAFSNGMGDVDIANYLVTKQKGNALWSWQNYDWNFWAMADRADQGGKHTEAAELRCLVKDIATHFGDRCVSAMTFLPMIVEMPTEAHDTEDDDDDYREEQIQIQQTYVENMAELESRVARVESVRQTPRQIIQQPFLSDEKKAALRELKK